MPDDTNFVPRLDGTGSLGRTNKQWNEVHAKTYHGDGSNLTGVVTGSVEMGGTMTAHIIPDSNSAYDLGNAEYKIRHLFLSDNSLWVGDEHKISIGDDGKMKFRKRDNTTIPRWLAAVDPAVVGNLQPPLTLAQLKGYAEDPAVRGHIVANPDSPYMHESEIGMDELFDPGDFIDEISNAIELPVVTPGASLPSLIFSEIGTMVYDNRPGVNKVKVVAVDDNGDKVWKTLSFE